MSIDIKQALIDLRAKRKVFHSEADFQHALAWTLHEQDANSNLRLEYPMNVATKRIHVDIFATCNNVRVAIELKYKTRELKVKFKGEAFALKSQSAQDCGRYDFLLDIERLEKVKQQKSCNKAFAVFVTNDQAYWKPPRNTKQNKANSKQVTYYDFRLCEGRTVSGNLAWQTHASEGTKKGRKKNILLNNTYAIKWDEYARIGQETGERFRILLLEIL